MVYPYQVSIVSMLISVFITTSISSSAYNVFQIATGEEELTAKQVGFTVLLAFSGPAAGKLIKLLAKKHRDKILKIPGRVRSRVNLAKCMTRKKSGRCSEGWEHVVDEHFSGKPAKSQFSVAQAELEKILQSQK